MAASDELNQAKTALEELQKKHDAAVDGEKEMFAEALAEARERVAHLEKAGGETEKTGTPANDTPANGNGSEGE